MRCPACGGFLEELPVGSITVSVCTRTCGGMWFDSKELQKVDEAFEAEGRGVAKFPVPARNGLTHSLRRSCPRCEDVAMMRRFTSLLREVDVDECPGCGGFWLDAGKLARVRGENWETGTREKLKSAATENALGAEWEAWSHADAEAWRAMGRISRVLRIDLGRAG